MWNDFPSFLTCIFLSVLPSSLLANSHIFEISEDDHHRYRRPRLPTRPKRRAKFENPRWRLNRSKIIERHREKPCFLHFMSSYCFRSRWTTFFWEEPEEVGWLYRHALRSLLFTIAIFDKRLVKSCWNILRFLSLKISFFRRYVFIFVLLKNLVRLFLTCLV
jgi:hypothetical protein